MATCVDVKLVHLSERERERGGSGCYLKISIAPPLFYPILNILVQTATFSLPCIKYLFEIVKLFYSHKTISLIG